MLSSTPGACTSLRTMSGWPPAQATIRAVRPPSGVARLTSIPGWASSHATTASLLCRAATTSPDSPSLDTVFTSRPRDWQHTVTLSTWFLLQAFRNCLRLKYVHILHLLLENFHSDHILAYLVNIVVLHEAPPHFTQNTVIKVLYELLIAMEKIISKTGCSSYKVRTLTFADILIGVAAGACRHES